MDEPTLVELIEAVSMNPYSEEANKRLELRLASVDGNHCTHRGRYYRYYELDPIPEAWIRGFRVEDAPREASEIDAERAATAAAATPAGPGPPG